MLNNLETIKQTTEETLQLLANIQSEMDSILKLGLFDDSQLKKLKWERVKQLLHNEHNILIQIDDIQSYLCSIIKELDKVKPTMKDQRLRKQMLDNFLDSMKYKEFSFANREELTREFVKETKKGIFGSLANKLKDFVLNKEADEKEMSNVKVQGVIESEPIMTTPIITKTNKKNGV